MTTALRIVDIYIVGNQETDASGKPLAQPSRMTRCESVLLRVHLLNADGTEYQQLPTALAFSYGLDNNYTAGNPDPVASNNSKFIAGDWPESEGVPGWNLSKGRFCVRVNLTPAGLGTALAAKPEMIFQHAAWAYADGMPPFLLFNISVWIDNVTVEPVGATAAEPDTPDIYVRATDLVLPAGYRLRVTTDGQTIVEALS